MRIFLLLLIILLIALATWAKPPTVPGYARVDEVERELAAAHVRLRAAEEFAAKPIQERLVIKFHEGAESYEHLRRLDGEDLVEELLEKWKEAQTDEPDAEVVRILGLLPAALKARYSVSPIPKRDRHKASKPLVDALTDKYLPIRTAAIECLKEIYGQTRLYQPDLPSKRRLEIQKDWKKQIDRLAK